MPCTNDALQAVRNTIEVLVTALEGIPLEGGAWGDVDRATEKLFEAKCYLLDALVKLNDPAAVAESESLSL